jgi:hypothetical protein
MPVANDTELTMRGWEPLSWSKPGRIDLIVEVTRDAVQFHAACLGGIH